jgi:6-pyruvoyltetrahydropterin/6-carboxytetrahydropterin synthase
MIGEGFEVGTGAPLRAVHRLPWMTGPEAEPHAHDYRVRLTVRRAALDDRGMVCDLDLLDGALGDLLDQLDGQDLDAIVEDADAVTVEVLARWLHERLREPVRSAGGEWLSVQVWESPEAFGAYRGPVRSA